ncbi:hypothetical protein [Ramlibacter sp.]|uniref:hypothetical protein n=1 Tax=Ramlibacter sp. TaxID=1917967 RepID=UPI0017DBDF1C|nr:hypothetical protein [Ramlibacter sp.]MBA2676505.1 hypothetical protein [Ramlibacter sp.]
MHASPPSGQTPPTPGLDKEEPEFMVESDIPVSGETRGNGRGVADPRPVSPAERE